MTRPPAWRRSSSMVAAAVLQLAVAVTPSSAAELAVDVAVGDNAFDPTEVRVDPAADDTVTVTWTWRGGNTHTVTADDGSWGSGQQSTGTFDHTFTERGTYAYYCQIHGRGSMSGVIQIGPPAEPEPVTATHLYVPTDRLTLEQAVQRAAPGTTIVLEPGTHVVREPVRITVPDLTIRGGSRPDTAGAPPEPVSRDAVVVSSLGSAPYAFEIRARDGDPATEVTLEDLTVLRFRLGGVLVDTADDYVLQRLALHHPERHWDHGIVAVDSPRGVIRDVEVTGARFAGISLRRSSDVVVDTVTVADSFIGLEQIGTARNLQLRDSTFRDNANGIILQSDAQAPASSLTGATITDTEVRNNLNPDAPRPPVFVHEEIQPGAGVGIWLAGASGALVAGNAVIHNRYGIVLTARGDTADHVVVSRNLTTDSTTHDLAWDGVGVNTCFIGNTTSTSGVEPNSNPPQIQTLYPCPGPTVGVPNPSISTDLMLTAMETYYCQIDARLCRQPPPD